jgi:cellulose synthase/poly-beta-1,6-N-acetylglucosamine synthase-like glycosyltransferase
MRTLFELVSWLGGVAVFIPGAILFAEAVLASIPNSEDQAPADSTPTPGAVIIVPAHDEVGQIEATVCALAAQLPDLRPGARLIVVADNCHDETAAVAKAAGAEVIERNDPLRIGKGFAISFALDHLASNPPEVVILVDADCRVSPGGLAELARAAAWRQVPIQGEYLLAAPEKASPMAVVSALAFLVRNRVRPRGLRRLGFPCHLTGSGMAIPWQVLRDAPSTGANLVEDLVLGLELALLGKAPELCPAVQIASELPPDRAAGRQQRRRWEHGQLQTLFHYVPRLIAAGLARGRPGLVALGLDLAVPPLALLVALELGWLGVTIVAAAVHLTSARPACLAALDLGLVVAAVGLAWAVFGRRTLPFRYLVFVPIYLVWKIPIYLALAIGGKQSRWERTARPAAPPRDDTPTTTPRAP